MLLMTIKKKKKTIKTNINNKKNYMTSCWNNFKIQKINKKFKKSKFS